MAAAANTTTNELKAGLPVDDCGWAPRVPNGHTPFSWKRPDASAVATATATARPVASAAPIASASGAAVASAAAAGADSKDSKSADNGAAIAAVLKRLSESKELTYPVTADSNQRPLRISPLVTGRDSNGKSVLSEDAKDLIREIWRLKDDAKGVTVLPYVTTDIHDSIINLPSSSGGIKAGKRAAKTAEKHAALKAKEAEKKARAEAEEAKKKAAAAAAGAAPPTEKKTKGRIKPKADGAPAAGAASTGDKPDVKSAGATAVPTMAESPTGFVGASQPPSAKGGVLPIPGKRNILITSALPYVNNVPHLGNIIGCVLSGDVYARFCRLRGHNTLYVCGTDEYGTATETKAILDKVTPKELCDRFHVIHRDIYSWFNIGFDHFGRTTTPQQTAIAQDIFWACDKNKLVLEDSVEQLYCESCQRFLADRFIEGVCPNCKYEDARGDQCDQCGKLLNATELIDPKCKLCRRKPVSRSSKHLFLDLPTLTKELKSFVDKSSKEGDWTANSIQITNSWLRDGLQNRCISRDLKWGTPVPKPGFTDKVFYVWFDAPIGYISITANYTEKWQEWWKNPANKVQLYQFMGKDNIPFHTVIFPSTLLGTKQPYTLLHHISTCEYLNYESGKFSKSRGTGVFGDDAVKSGIPSEVWRYYLLITRPETSDSVFLWDQFTSSNNSELLANLGNYVQRSLTFVKGSFGGVVPQAPAGVAQAIDTQFIRDVNEQTAIYIKQLEAVQIRDALKTVMKIAALGNKYTQDNKPWVLFKSTVEAEKKRCNLVVSLTVHAIRWLALLAEPYMPTVSDKICHQLNIKLRPGLLADQKVPATAADAKSTGAGSVPFDTNAFAAGHVIGEPIPIFREIKVEERDELKSRFVGKQDTKEVSALPFPLSVVVGKVTSVAVHEKNASLYVCQVDVGEKEGPRLFISSLAGSYSPAELKDRNVLVATNIKPAGTPKVSAVVLCADVKDAKDATKTQRVLLVAGDAKLAPGTKVAPKGVKVVPQKNFAFKTALPSLALRVDATGAALYGDVVLEIDGKPIKADKNAVNTTVSV